MERTGGERPAEMETQRGGREEENEGTADADRKEEEERGGESEGGRGAKPINLRNQIRITQTR